MTHPGQRLQILNQQTIQLEERTKNNPYKGKFALDEKGMKLFREKIRDGGIPIGPKPDHSTPVVDIRDNTDPQKIGLEIIARRNGG